MAFEIYLKINKVYNLYATQELVLSCVNKQIEIILYEAIILCYKI